MNFKIDKSRFFLTPILISLMVVVLSLFSKDDYNFYILIIIIILINIVFYSKYLTNYLSEIIIDEDSNTCHFKFIIDFTHQEEKTYPLDVLKGVYEKITRARGIQSEVFRIYEGDSMILTINPDVDGWSKENCNQLAVLLGSKNLNNSSNE